MESDALRDWLIERWNGPRWWLWTFAAGLLLLAATVAVAVALAYLLGHNPAALTMLGLLIEILVISIIGSGFVDSLSRRLSMGGLARETADLEEMTESERERVIEYDRRRSERKTLAAGIIVLPLFVTFCILLFS